ncbi:hypothetical protein MPTK1_6g08270 [Marchantia polymorpha subsp. ruderalis]|uniref:Uncharacterized protein n=2 Tax=Marchantia polymorpha TaxID=3197 RepID=A0AAF6BPT8_MARPO|nr:hypothetical protein MARPO_0060s0094 [Marchantia polymorpha]PTQ37023.1 hypothetical protein MARPO_0060s0094 [Marchantia polymorpha]BBN14022.1 hypothetical protein Mp_6g08270 [Marchantia polymorpha subsp. ruderalis]BBN14023.1 hypothetical protein Mp_6g08270 [Marchantia polymorpha subsp. ruderalis]|eukprot:PTQ37022.1 hypothetical protein MARPO_0060s0094 [Marchantia polymorpha]
MESASGQRSASPRFLNAEANVRVLDVDEGHEIGRSRGMHVARAGAVAVAEWGALRLQLLALLLQGLERDLALRGLQAQPRAQGRPARRQGQLHHSSPGASQFRLLPLQEAAESARQQDRQDAPLEFETAPRFRLTGT